MRSFIVTKIYKYFHSVHMAKVHEDRDTKLLLYPKKKSEIFKGGTNICGVTRKMFFSSIQWKKIGKRVY